ncbi:MAG: hypothetical protein FJX47_10745 [Alphaproteobacteria bacterium]|nr:hypothetical protein [Alphaproteobacteria bacterium]
MAGGLLDHTIWSDGGQHPRSNRTAMKPGLSAKDLADEERSLRELLRDIKINNALATLKEHGKSVDIWPKIISVLGRPPLKKQEQLKKKPKDEASRLNHKTISVALVVDTYLLATGETELTAACKEIAKWSGRGSADAIRSAYQRGKKRIAAADEGVRRVAAGYPQMMVDEWKKSGRPFREWFKSGVLSGKWWKPLIVHRKRRSKNAV